MIKFTSDGSVTDLGFAVEWRLSGSYWCNVIDVLICEVHAYKTYTTLLIFINSLPWIFFTDDSEGLEVINITATSDDYHYNYYYDYNYTYSSEN